jgi:hypothetical protein
MNLPSDLKHYLDDYIKTRNNRAALFKEAPISSHNLTPAARKALLESLEYELSPENLTCDGELRGNALRSKTILLTGAKKALQLLEAGPAYR